VDSFFSPAIAEFCAEKKISQEQLLARLPWLAGFCGTEAAVKK